MLSCKRCIDLTHTIKGENNFNKINLGLLPLITRNLMLIIFGKRNFIVKELYMFYKKDALS